ncbi:MAG: hypothetical protein L3J17_13975 [Candidatus Jettenia sp.]|nr:MAG: hypothetical protein L3J17_13975 [Candidatus Jettenia sp.]
MTSKVETQDFASLQLQHRVSLCLTLRNFNSVGQPFRVATPLHVQTGGGKAKASPYIDSVSVSMVNIDHYTGEHVIYKTSSPPYAVWFQSLITIRWHAATYSLYFKSPKHHHISSL